MTENLYLKFMMEKFDVEKKIIAAGIQAQKNILPMFEKINSICEFNQMKILHAMQKNKLSDSHFNFSNGYGYNDAGRDILEKIYCDIFNTEDSLVRINFVSGTHALSCAFFGNLNFGEELIYISGEPYDSLKNIIQELIKHGIKYKKIELKNNKDFDFDTIKKNISSQTKIIAIQKSRGYSLRESLSVKKIGAAIKFIKKINPNIICLVDNCYGEFVEKFEPSNFNADLTIGSLIKNPGGGIAKTGAYITGKKNLIKNCSCQLFAPGLEKKLGASLGESFYNLYGLFVAPQVISCALKTAIFAAEIFSMFGFEVFPKSNENRTDIIQAVNLKSKKNLIKFCEGVQKASPVNSFFTPIPEKIPGYDCEIIMAAGNFIQGSSIEFSADAPIRDQYTVFIQGALTWFHGKNAILIALDRLLNKRK